MINLYSRNLIFLVPNVCLELSLDKQLIKIYIPETIIVPPKESRDYKRFFFCKQWVYLVFEINTDILLNNHNIARRASFRMCNSDKRVTRRQQGYRKQERVKLKMKGRFNLDKDFCEPDTRRQKAN